MIDHDRRVELLLQPVEQVQDLGLHRHVERRRGLVGDQQVRVQRERHGDHRSLAHAAGELVRVLVGALVRARDPDPAEHLDGLLVRLLLGDLLVRRGRPRRSGRRPCRTGAGTSSGPGRSSRSSRRGSVRISSGGSVSRSWPWKMTSPSMIGPLGVDEPHHRQERDALAGAGLPHDPERLARAQRERDAVDRLDQAVFRREMDLRSLTSRSGSATTCTSPAGRGTRRRCPRTRFASTMKNAAEQRDAHTDGKSWLKMRVHRDTARCPGG